MERLIIGFIAGLAIGTLVAFLNSRITKKLLLDDSGLSGAGPTDTGKVMAVNVVRLLVSALTLLVIFLVLVPFAPFLLLNARKKKAQEERQAFASENVSEAVCAIFRQVITWLKETGHDGGNLLYQDWTDALPGSMPDGYAARFSACARDYEEAAYSSHDLPEEKRRRALSLLKETETALLKTADWKQRLRIRYWMCLCE